VELQSSKTRKASERWNGSSEAIVQENAAASAQQQSHQLANDSEQTKSQK
jgi:hypothetical protein